MRAALAGSGQIRSVAGQQGQQGPQQYRDEPPGIAIPIRSIACPDLLALFPHHFPEVFVP